MLLKSYDTILEKFAPDGILINHDREVLHYLGNAGNIAFPPRDAPRATSYLCSAAISNSPFQPEYKRILKHSKPVKSLEIRCTTRHGSSTVDLTIEPFEMEDSAQAGLILITFIERDESSLADIDVNEQPIPFKIDAGKENRILMLEDELRSTKENLQATVEELQTSNEELQAINEEVQVSNEELQSTNEELHR